MRIAIGCDHAGSNLKQFVLKLITDGGHNYQDFGCHNTDPVDYPDIARKVGEAVARGECERGIVVCGSGIGMSIAANKVKGIRAALCHDAASAHQARQHNDANILCLGVQGEPGLISEIVEAFLAGAFEGGRHLRRLKKIVDMEG